MTYDDVLDTLKGKVTNEPLISLWRHYPEIDLDLDKLVDATIKDYKRFPSDLLKLSPHARYCTMDFGCKIVPGTGNHGDTGASSCKECVVKSPRHWKRIESVDPLIGEYGRNIRYVESVAKALPDIPKMMTIFAPTMVARKLSHNEFISHLELAERDVLEAFKIINSVTIEFARACIDAGADGIFIATQEADTSVIPESDLSRSILKMNSQFVNLIRKKAEFTVLHIHGTKTHFKDALESLPTDAINWHDKTSDISIQDARKYFSGGLLAGLEPDEILDGITKHEIEPMRSIREELPFILAPGCVLLQGTEEKTLDNIFKYYR